MSRLTESVHEVARDLRACDGLLDINELERLDLAVRTMLAAVTDALESRQGRVTDMAVAHKAVTDAVLDHARTGRPVAHHAITDAVSMAAGSLRADHLDRLTEAQT